MKATLLVFVWVLWFALPASAQQITLVYPRAEAGQVYTYPATLDSTFVLGRVEPPRGELFINNVAVPLTARGAFLAWLPLVKDSTHRAWQLSLRRGGSEIASLRFPYGLAPDTVAAIAPDSLSAIRYPRVLRVAVPNAHARTAVSGGYFLFPDSGCSLLAISHENGFYRIDLGAGLWSVIEDRFVTLDSWIRH